METLSPAEECFVNNVYLTRTGYKSGGALPGRWPNFANSLNDIGVLTRGIDALEHIQGNGRASVRLEFAGVSLGLAERVRSSGLIADSTVGVARRYRVPGGVRGARRDAQDVMWIFHKIAGYSCTFEFQRGLLKMTFAGELKDIKMLGRSVAASPLVQDRRVAKRPFQAERRRVSSPLPI